MTEGKSLAEWTQGIEDALRSSRMDRIDGRLIPSLHVTETSEEKPDHYAVSVSLQLRPPWSSDELIGKLAKCAVDHEVATIIKQLVEQAKEFRYGTGHLAKDDIGKAIEALTASPQNKCYPSHLIMHPQQEFVLTNSHEISTIEPQFEHERSNDFRGRVRELSAFRELSVAEGIALVYDWRKAWLTRSKPRVELDDNADPPKLFLRFDIKAEFRGEYAAARILYSKTA